MFAGILHGSRVFVLHFKYFPSGIIRLKLKLLFFLGFMPVTSTSKIKKTSSVARQKSMESISIVALISDLITSLPLLRPKV